VTLDDLKTPNTVLHIGVAPRRIAILMSIDGVEFDEAWPQRMIVEIEGQTFAVLSRAHLLQNKKAAGLESEEP
jgi:hypothetical protein